VRQPSRAHQRPRPRLLGCRPQIPQTFVEDAEPRRHARRGAEGSVGASGDLAPMRRSPSSSWVRQAFYGGERLPVGEALERAGIARPGSRLGDGLAASTGANVLTAMSALQLHDIERWLRHAEIACAMSLEALLANLKPVRRPRARAPRVPGRGARQRAAIMRCIAGSDLLRGRSRRRSRTLLDALLTPGDRRGARRRVAFARSAGRDRG